MIGHLAVEAQTTKPAVRQVEVHLLAQPPLRADAKAVADDQHPDQQLRVDRRPPHLAVERSQFLPQPVEFDEPVDRAQQVPFRHMPFERELVKKGVLPDAAFPHHWPSPRSPRTGLNQPSRAPATPDFFNRIDPYLISDIYINALAVCA